MAELEWSKERCEKEDGTTHYDSFKKQKDIDKLATATSNFFFKFLPPSIQRRYGVGIATEWRGYSNGLDFHF